MVNTKRAKGRELYMAVVFLQKYGWGGRMQKREGIIAHFSMSVVSVAKHSVFSGGKVSKFYCLATDLDHSGGWVQ